MQALGRIFKCQTGEITEKQSTGSQSNRFFLHQAETVMNEKYFCHSQAHINTGITLTASMKAPPGNLHLF
ncbi:hypothetical protein GZ78_23045 [Endozoicomonas numazuensis]|uniref:Uncharacterized protein n=1 Tax=Endozoicomonas numazuensis TaxID=1137799 RepID=A0A081NCG8_9GAMM|nr:hypothetical protein GZ78_23045 [Endozoicomonas numazuensis]